LYTFGSTLDAFNFVYAIKLIKLKTKKHCLR